MVGTATVCQLKNIRNVIQNLELETSLHPLSCLNHLCNGQNNLTTCSMEEVYCSLFLDFQFFYSLKRLLLHTGLKSKGLTEG